MAECVYEPICKLLRYESNECALSSVCKLFSEIIPKADKPVKRDPDDMEPEEGPTAKQVKAARWKIGQHKDGLDENQKKALEALEGKHYASLTPAQKQQIVSIAKDL